MYVHLIYIISFKLWR